MVCIIIMHTSRNNVHKGSSTEDSPPRTQKEKSASTITEKKLEIAMRTKRRAQNVFAEHIDLSGTFQSARFPKSPYVKGTIRQALLSNFVFSTLTPGEVEEFVDYMKMEKFEVSAKCWTWKWSRTYAYTHVHVRIRILTLFSLSLSPSTYYAERQRCD